jgi:iron complex transport system substrate-binding protein
MHQYWQRLQKLQDSLKAVSSDQGLSFPFKVSVVRIYPDTLSLYFRDSFCGIILQDAGLLRPDAQDISASEAKRWFSNEVQGSISLEQVEQADGDVMFVWTSEDSVAADQSAKKRLENLQTEPLWQQLNAIKRNRVYFVPEYWIGSGPIAANAVIDDLFKYLVKPS